MALAKDSNGVGIEKARRTAALVAAVTMLAPGQILVLGRMHAPMSTKWSWAVRVQAGMPHDERLPTGHIFRQVEQVRTAATDPAGLVLKALVEGGMGAEAVQLAAAFQTAGV